MKRTSIIMVIILTGFLVTPKLFAQDSGNEEASRQAVASCRRAQQYINNIQKPRDLRGRVDRLQAYRYIYQRLDGFVIRLERNNQFQAKEMRTSLDSLYKQINVFKDDYETYDEARDKVATFNDCQKNNQQFTDALQLARQKRQIVHDDITSLDATLTPKIKTQLDNLHQYFLQGDSIVGDNRE